MTPAGVVLNGKPLEIPVGPSDMLSTIYRRYVNDYPKFFKMDRLGKLGFLASELLLQSLDEARFVPRDDRAVILFNSSGSHDADVHYQATINDKDHFFPSPSLFVYTLPNIVAGEIAIRNCYLGQTAFYVLANHDSQTIRQMVEAAFMDAGTRSILTGWVDYYAENRFEARMTIISI